MKYKISIIINAYKCNENISTTLKSVINQTIGIKNLDVFLVTKKFGNYDYSKISEYVNKYENIKVIFPEKDENLNNIINNLILKNMSSDYVMFLDNDCYLENNACEILYGCIIDESADIVSGSSMDVESEDINYEEWVNTLTKPSDSYQNRENKTKKELSKPDFKLIVTDQNNCGQIFGNSNLLGKLFKTSLIKNNNILFYNENIRVDSLFLPNTFLNSSKTVFIKNKIIYIFSQEIQSGNMPFEIVECELKKCEILKDVFNQNKKQNLFNEFVLGYKLIKWYEDYLLNSYVATTLITFNLFKDHSGIFTDCFNSNFKLPDYINDIFEDISHKKFDVAATKTSKLQSKYYPVIIKNPVKISIIIPVYNNQKFLEKCLDSIINQSLKEIEIICIDDGSTDDSLEILKKYESMDSRIKVFSQNNSGAATARNKGIEVSNGEYILFVDSDDWLSEDALIDLLENAVSNKSDLVLFNAVEHKNNNVLNNRIYMDVDSSKNYNYFTFNYKYLKRLVMNSFLVIWSKFYKTSFLKDNKIQFSNHELFNDIQFHIKTMLLAKKISYCPKILYNYLRIDQPSLQNRKGLTDKSFIILEIMNEIELYLKENNYYNEMELYFLKFKINELRVRLFRVNEEYKESLYKLLKETFMNMDISSHKLKQLPFKNYRFFINILNHNSYLEFKQIYVPKNSERYGSINDLKREVDSIHNKYLFKQFVHDLTKDDSLYLALNKINQLNLFDERYYREKYNYDSDLSPLLHYIYEGYKNGNNPCEKFNTNFYENTYRSVAESHLNPLVYFVLHGLKTGEILINKEVPKLPCVNKEKLDYMIKKINKSCITKHKREKKVIVSLTSFPDRIHDLHYCIYSLLTQNFTPDEVILWLAESQFPEKYNNLSKDLLNLQNYGLTIKWCENIYSYKKLIPQLKEDSNNIIVTADDDIYYPDFWLQNLMEQHYKDSNSIICYRARKIKFNNDGDIEKYKNWDLLFEEQDASYLNFFTGAGGVLYPPNSLNKQVFNEKLFQELCPNGDDIWFWGMAILNQTKIKLVSGELANLTFINPSREMRLFDEVTLYSLNKQGNDKQIKNLLNHFPEILRIITSSEF